MELAVVVLPKAGSRTLVLPMDEPGKMRLRPESTPAPMPKAESPRPAKMPAGKMNLAAPISAKCPPPKAGARSVAVLDPYNDKPKLYVFGWGKLLTIVAVALGGSLLLWQLLFTAMSEPTSSIISPAVIHGESGVTMTRLEPDAVLKPGDRVVVREPGNITEKRIAGTSDEMIVQRRNGLVQSMVLLGKNRYLVIDGQDSGTVVLRDQIIGILKEPDVIRGAQ